jgi:hypothetical protein
MLSTWRKGVRLSVPDTSAARHGNPRPDPSLLPGPQWRARHPQRRPRPGLWPCLVTAGRAAPANPPPPAASPLADPGGRRGQATAAAYGINPGPRSDRWPRTSRCGRAYGPGPLRTPLPAVLGEPRQAWVPSQHGEIPLEGGSPTGEKRAGSLTGHSTPPTARPDLPRRTHRSEHHAHPPPKRPPNGPAGRQANGRDIQAATERDGWHLKPLGFVRYLSKPSASDAPAPGRRRSRLWVAGF